MEREDAAVAREQAGIAVSRASRGAAGGHRKAKRCLAMSKQKPVVGLDIGSSSIKAVELKHSKQGYELVSFGLEPLAQDTVVDGAIMDAPLVAGAIGTIFDRQEIKTRSVATAVSGHSVIVKRVTLPVMTEEELYDRIQSEASQHIPFDISDVNLDYQLLDSHGFADGRAAGGGEKRQDSEPHQRAGAGGQDAHGGGYRRLRAAELLRGELRPRSRRRPWRCLNIGASVMNINIVRGGIPLFTRDVSVGGNQYTDALQKELDLSYEDAERLKKGEAIAGVAEEHRGTILRSVSDILILEIQKTFDFFRATASGENIQRIYLAGGTARVPGLVDLLREEFALPVEELYPFRKIVINPGRHNEDQVRELAPRLAIAVGLALRSFDTP